MVMSIADRFTPRMTPSRGKRPRVGIALLCILSMAMMGIALYKAGFFSSATKEATLSQPIEETPPSILDNPFLVGTKIYDEVRAGENLFSTLKRMEVPAKEADLLIKGLGKELNVRQVRSGSVVMVESAQDHLFLADVVALQAGIPKLKSVEIYTKDENNLAYSVKALVDSDGQIKISKNKSKLYREHSIVSGAVNNSIYSSIISNGGDPQLVNSYADIFAWQIDFSRESREGDTYQMVIEKSVADGRFVGYGRILAAEYVNSRRTLRGFYFESADKQISGYFDDEGKSLRNAFLKAPLKLASITSRFGMRFHPIQKRMKPHNGVDYPSNRGTPFMAVASGIVVNAGYTRFNGNWVRIKHMNGYETEYLHATKLAKGIYVGAQVRQGQVIGYVGMTGLASGYHLHYGMKRNGSYVDPTKQNFARGLGIPTRYQQEFSSNIAPMVIALNRQAPKGPIVALLE